ncbi:MAG: CARDB domain-containing protein [Candidatus Methanofastidiosia archaeon]
MRKGYILVFLVMIAALTSFHNVEPSPYATPRKLSIYMPEHWHVHECEECLSGYMCRYQQWVPSVYIYKYPIWVFGISNEQQCGGILNFRPYPDYDCPQNCTEDIPVLYTAEVVYVPPWNPDFKIEDVPLTFIPPGRYVVTSPSFLVGDDTLWYFPNDGNGQKMSVFLYPEEEQYTRDDTVKLILEATDTHTGKRIKVDAITGKIELPDWTIRTITTDMWTWNSDDLRYEYDYDLRNNLGKRSNPEDGTYSVSVTVSKTFHSSVGTSTEFRVVSEPKPECSLSGMDIVQLADMYAPFMCFYEGSYGKERYFPTETDSMLENSTLWKYDYINHHEQVLAFDDADNKGNFISEYGPDYFLDANPIDFGIKSELIDQYAGDRHVYYRVICSEYQNEMYIVIQYWFFYLYNDGPLNDHEGEWEMVEVLLDHPNRHPIGAAYSRHEWGEFRLWEEVKKVDETHPVVYVAEGSHGAYFTAAKFKVKRTLDVTSDDGWKGYFSSSTILGDQSWLDFGGNWGYRSIISVLSAPHGPEYQGEKWDSPVEWAFDNSGYYTEVIEDYPQTSFSLSCPADMLITNSAGQRLGFVNGEFVQEIPDSYVHDLDEEESYLIEGIDTYMVEIYGTGEGTFDLAISMNCWDSARTLKYTNVPVTLTTRAFLDMGSDFCLRVDSNQDDIIDFIVQPQSLVLSSPQPIKPLQQGVSVTYEVIITNVGDAASFALDVDIPPTWSYTLSSDTVFLDSGESTTILLTTTIPSETVMQDYFIRFEASSMEENTFTATLDLIASSKSELTIESIAITQQGENVMLTALVSNMGLMDAENVKVQFWETSVHGDNLLGEQIMTVPSGDEIYTSILCALPDGLYTFLVTVDPDDLIYESCELNNRLSSQYLLDRTPPEAEVFFDPSSEDIMVKGVDNLDSLVDISMTEETTKNKSIRIYTLTDDAGNKTEVRLQVSRHGQEITSEVVDLKYNGQSVTVPENSLKIEYIIQGNEAKMLNQFLRFGDTDVHLIYQKEKDQTKIVVNGKQQVEDGVLLLVLKTWEGSFQYRVEEMR